jgi:hypothetical protein
MTTWTGPYGTSRVLIPPPADPRYAHLSWPKLVRADDGTLVLALIAGRQHIQGDGCPTVARSLDGGKTWLPMQILQHFDRSMRYQHAGNLALGKAADGALVLLGMAFTDKLYNTILGWRSTDAGQHWEPCDTQPLADNQTGSVFGHVFPLPEQSLGVFGHVRQPRGTGLWFARSLNHGRNWLEPTIFTTRHLVEPVFITAGTRLIGLVRDDSACAYHQFVSDDLGQTWQCHERVIAGTPGVVHPSPCLVADPRRPERLYALHTERSPQREIILWQANAATLRWHRLGVLLACPGAEDFGYPWLCHLHDDQWLMVFYGGAMRGANAIHGLRLTLPDTPLPS